MSSGNYTPQSLVSHFSPPKGYVGTFGWISGFSADFRFLNEAGDRFTGLGSLQRMQMGEVRLALMLDPHQPALLPTSVPGLAHLPLRDPGQKPFRLMHAKVAVLGFRHEQDAARWCVRLVVSTGNWTRQTVEDSLDLACDLQVFSETLGQADCAQERVDIKAATQFLAALRALYDTRLLDAGIPLTGGDAAVELDEWLRACGKKVNNPQGLLPRFIDSRTRPLLTEILDAVGARQRKPSGYLAMGSGFYEGSANGTSDGNARPVVPVKVVSRLKQAHLLKERGKVELYVEPTACQSIAAAVYYLGQHPDHAIAVHAAVPNVALYGERSARTLHAKFIFAANRSEQTGACNNAWLYMGSGNFTDAGMLQKMSAGGGNLEAGMVLFPDDLYWRGNSKDPALLSNRLPVGGPLLDADAPGLSAGEPWQPPTGQNDAAPLAFLHWREEGILAPSAKGEDAQPLPDGVDVLDESGEACAHVAGGYAWPGTAPRMVRLRWQRDGEQREAWVPVIDAFGRVAATPLGVMELADVEQQLMSFPGVPEPEGDVSEYEDNEDGPGGPPGSTRAAQRAVSQGAAIRQMMGMVERIASRQVDIAATDWARWCVRLEQTLCQAQESEAVNAFVAMGINPLSPLRAAPFRPPYAEDGTVEPGMRYEAMLDRVEQAWRTQGLAAVEGVA
ncbi:hypothetical protein [Stenotrophomonas sp. ESTM1D_MKCIP4_1]|uniref:hypothetical protein n=1 Tax=Stenotrophomonas sp. ESTM1D_MKCIP4_1 TaxID=2072414 RepID=UPI00131F0B5D|nr:hypothetical protein [Stenotrophomonas sp. ESTM1D_MKCIP4_1]